MVKEIQFSYGRQTVEIFLHLCHSKMIVINFQLGRSVLPMEEKKKINPHDRGTGTLIPSVQR